MLKNGEILDGRYQIIREIGTGGTGIVFLGYHLTLCKYVVIKKIKDHFVGNINARGEVDILKKLHHRYLPQVYDFLVIGTGVYTIMDYVDGYDLSKAVENGYVFTEDQLVCMLKQLCEVLQYLHSQNPPVIHSDIKPGNIMLREDGDICLIDFNISLDGDVTAVLGYSPHFAAPEQLELTQAILYGKKHERLKVDEKSDLYSLGATFYYLMTGILPECRAGQKKDFEQVSGLYSGELIKIVSKAMEPSRPRRYSSAAKMLSDLENIHTVRKRMIVGLSLMLAVFLVSGGIVTGIYLVNRSRQDRFIQAFYRFSEQRSKGDQQAMRKQGMEILNERELKGQLDSHPQQKGEILAGIAESYYEEELFEIAAGYYREALECQIDSEKQLVYLRDYILTLIKSGNKSDAQQELDLARNVFSADILSYLEAELLLEEEKWEEAYEILKQLAVDSDSLEIRQRSYLQAIDCLKDTGRDQERLELLEQAQLLTDNRTLLRKVAETYVEIAQSSGGTAITEEALTGARQCFELICREADAAYMDRLNYAIVLEMQMDYRSAFEVLQKLEEDFPQDYRTYREEAWLCYWMELEKNAESRDFQGVLYYAGQALAYYTETGERDEKMMRLEELIAQLSK